MTIAAISHIGLDERGQAMVIGTRTRVSLIVRDSRIGMSPKDIHEAYEDLSLAQIHAALAYYYDHQTEMSEQIRQEDEWVDSLRDEARSTGRAISRAELDHRIAERPAR